MTTSMYCLYVGFDYTYIDVNALAQGIKSFLASHVWSQAVAGARTYGTDSPAITVYVCMCVCMYVYVYTPKDKCSKLSGLTVRHVKETFLILLLLHVLVTDENPDNQAYDYDILQYFACLQLSQRAEYR